MKIRTKKDAEKFLQSFNKKSIFIFRDSEISMIGGGSTEISFDGENFLQFSQGQNWQDQQKSIIKNPIDFVYRKRKDINGGQFL